MSKKTTDQKSAKQTEAKRPIELPEPDLERAHGGITQNNSAEPGKRRDANDRARPFVVDGPYT